MKHLFDLLTPAEREHLEKSLDLSSAATEQVVRKTREAREFLTKHCFFDPKAEEMWSEAPDERRRKILSELIWRANCILDKSSTAVPGLVRFSLGYGFKVRQAEQGGEPALIIVPEGP